MRVALGQMVLKVRVVMRQEQALGREQGGQGGVLVVGVVLEL